MSSERVHPALRYTLAACLVLVGSLVTVTSLRGDVATETVTYEYNGVQFEGYFAVDTAIEGPRPGVMVVHQWMGLGDYEKKRARQLAEMGYVAFAADVYGSDTRPETTHEAALASSTFRENRNRYRRRLNRSLDVLRNQSQVDADRLAAIGYCFGGTGVLELARSGADVDAVVSFHGGLTNPTPEDASNIQAAVQVHHGAEDANVTQQHVRSFWDEMNQYATVDWDLRVYSNAKHGFTESHSDAYNERADRLSWSAMKRLFKRRLRADE
jgi:dienelactone hydrolase